MSADNIILVKKVGKLWWVAYGFASHDESGSDSYMKNGTGYHTREAALVAAHNMEKEIGYVEYGVNELEGA